MSIFRSGPLPPGTTVGQPAWPRFDGGAGGTALEAAQAQLAAGATRTEVQTEQDATGEAASILNGARIEAARILQEAAAEAESALEEARAQGLAAGRAEGIASVQVEVGSLHEEGRLALDHARSEATAIRQAAEAEAKAIRAEAGVQAQAVVAEGREEAIRLLEEARKERLLQIDETQVALVELAVSAAMRLVQGHLALQPHSVVTMVAAGLRKLKDSNCTVKLSSQDLPLLEAQRSVLERELGNGHLQLQPDAGLGTGSYLASSHQGHIDGRLESQEALLRAAMKMALGGGGT